MGCAGRGIISAFEFLKEHKGKDPYEIIVYDVLGDVVCGGFAVPIRREYANTIYLVTSGEYMALYAANNILRGIHNYDGDQHRRVAGIIYNARNLEEEDERVKRFADAVNLPVCVKVPRSPAFARAEKENQTLMELDNCPQEQEVFRQLSRQILENPEVHHARPLSDEKLEEVVLETKISASGQTFFDTERTQPEEETREDEPSRTDIFSESRRPDRPALYGCAFNGAATAAIHLKDAIIIAHSPKACAFYTWQNISSPGRKNLFNRGILMPSAISPNFICTQMSQPEVVFGGMDRLRSCIGEAMKQRPGAVIVISSCVSGIIGDDLSSVEELSTSETPVIAIRADGDMAGDYMEGIRMCMYTLAQRLIDPSRTPSGRRVNLINETGVSTNLETNYQIIRDLLEQMEISVHCRYLGDTSCERMKHFLDAPVNILAADNAQGRELKTWLTRKYHCRFMKGAFPAGFQATKDWLLELGDLFSCREKALQVIASEENRYQEEIEELKPALEGKRIFITTINTNIDWLLETADRIGMEITAIGVLNYLRQPVKITDHPEKYRIMEELDWTRLTEIIHSYHPDILLSNYASELNEPGCVTDSMPMVPVVGFRSGVQTARRWVQLMKRQERGKWIHDKVLFEKYYA